MERCNGGWRKWKTYIQEGEGSTCLNFSTLSFKGGYVIHTGNRNGSVATTDFMMNWRSAGKLYTNLICRCPFGIKLTALAMDPACPASEYNVPRILWIYKRKSEDVDTKQVKDRAPGFVSTDNERTLVRGKRAKTNAGRTTMYCYETKKKTNPLQHLLLIWNHVLQPNQSNKPVPRKCVTCWHGPKYRKMKNGLCGFVHPGVSGPSGVYSWFSSSG